MPYDLLSPQERDALKPEQVAERGDLRQLRIFISHRWDQHSDVYIEVADELRNAFGRFQDLSIPEDKILTSDNGGYLDQFDLRSNIAGRIYSSDLIFCFSNVGMGMSESTHYEIQLAAVAYSVPIIFLRLPDQQNNARIVRQALDLGIQTEVVNIGTRGLVTAVQKLVTKEMLRCRVALDIDENSNLTYRGPNGKITDRVLREYPFLKFTGTMDIFQTDTARQASARRRRHRR